MPSPRVTVAFELSSGDRTISASAAIPNEKMRPADLVPVLLGLGNALVQLATAQAADEGRTISCREGCGACCRQLVPISETEAVYLAELVAAMPPERQAAIRERFREALEALGENLTGRLRDTSGFKTMEERRDLGIEYFARGVPCPFLGDERCSIYDSRPASCREYLVTSPAVNCRTPSPETVAAVRLPVKVSVVLYRFSDGIGNQPTSWIPLALALDWAGMHANQPQPVYPGPQMFRNFVSQASRLQRIRQDSVE